MLDTMRRKRRSTKMKSELGQSVDHFKRAASLAAQETSATVGPKFYAARDRMQPAAVKAKGAATNGWGSAVATLTPLVTAATESGRKSNEKMAKAGKKAAKENRKNAKKLEKRANKAMGRKESGRKGSRLLGLALIGGALGAGAAYVMRRRQAAQWDEYEPSQPLTTTTGAQDAAFGASETGYSTGTAVTGTATTSTATTGSAADIAAVTDEQADQTSSAKHSPKVARMAGGKNSTDPR